MLTTVIHDAVVLNVHATIVTLRRGYTTQQRRCNEAMLM